MVKPGFWLVKRFNHRKPTPSPTYARALWRRNAPSCGRKLPPAHRPFAEPVPDPAVAEQMGASAKRTVDGTLGWPLLVTHWTKTGQLELTKGVDSFTGHKASSDICWWQGILVLEPWTRSRCLRMSLFSLFQAGSRGFFCGFTSANRTSVAPCQGVKKRSLRRCRSTRHHDRRWDCIGFLEYVGRNETASNCVKWQARMAQICLMKS